MKLEKSNIYKLLDNILQKKQDFIDTYKEEPAVVLVSKKNFLKIRAWQVDQRRNISRVHGMLLLMDEQSDIFVGGT